MELPFVELVLVVLVSLLAGWFLRIIIDRSRTNSAEALAKKMVADAEKEAETLKREKLIEAKDEFLRLKQVLDDEHERKRNELLEIERQYRDKEHTLNRKLDKIERKEAENERLGTELEDKIKIQKVKENNLDRLIREQNLKLEKIARMTTEEAIDQLKSNLTDQAKQQSAETIKEIRDQARRQANREAQEIIVSAIQRSAADHTVECTVSVVNLPSDEIKGRIIGREGRNIRAFENATGVEIIVDDTPEAVIISGFDPLRREIARMALEKLMADGRIHPGRIEETVNKAEKEMDEKLVAIGEQAMMDTGVHGLHSELVIILGKLQFRTSYGQNVLQHSIEVSLLAGLMAAELGLEAKLAKRAGLLHDIGKAVDRGTEGTHTELGVELARKYKESRTIVEAIASHHEDVEFTSLVGVLIQAADAISGSRPGARRETLEGYIKRLAKLEEVAESFHGVSKSFAIQAGREVRIMVEHDKITDAQAERLASDIAQKIQEEMEYPGQIKVTVIREFRAVDFAK
ncbi:MAG: ribonuclease Y [candidate division Zixibacteria bacterium]|nr:ribonuclease Y [Candidatus Tariuqbacter arcticus]